MEYWRHDKFTNQKCISTFHHLSQPAKGWPGPSDDDDDAVDVVDTEHVAALATSGPCLSNYSSTFIQRYCEHHQPFFFSTFGFFFVSCLFFAMLRNLLSKQFIWTFNNENSSSFMLAAMVEDGGNNDNIVEN